MSLTSLTSCWYLFQSKLLNSACICSSIELACNSTWHCRWKGPECWWREVSALLGAVVEERDVHLLLLPLLSIWFPLLQAALSSQVLNHPSSCCSEWQQVPRSSLPLTHQFKHITGLSLSPGPTPLQGLQSQLQRGCCSHCFPSGLSWHAGLPSLWHLPSTFRYHGKGSKPSPKHWEGNHSAVLQPVKRALRFLRARYTQGHTRHLQFICILPPVQAEIRK